MSAKYQTDHDDKYTDLISCRVRRSLELFPVLPDDAMIDVRVVSIVLNRAVSSIWRDVKSGHFAAPVRVGTRSAKWRVGDVRTASRGGR
jgi:predicted DNA-binding transcriptional regulator AlpA